MKQRIELILYVSAVFLIAVSIFYGDQFAIWQEKPMGIGADGAKNFYSLAYHIAHDKSSWWFDGMNYPFGEHLMFTDGQPLIANLLRWANTIFPVESSLLFLLPLLLFGSYLVGAICLAYIINETGVKTWFSAISASGIMLLSPQLVRLSGHYSLAYAFVLPMLLMLCYRAYNSQKISSWVWVMLLLFLSGFIHPYFLAMGSMFVFLFKAICQISNKELLHVKAWLQTIGLSFGALILFQIILTISDPVSDRPDAPYGFLIYRATISSVFVPLVQWYIEPIQALLPWMVKKAAEGNFYVGIFAIIGSIWSLSIFTKSKNIELSKVQKFAFIAFFSSLPILILSFGFPFVIGPLENLLAYSGPLRQFRGIGRFSFVFFYAINLLAAIQVGLYFKKETTKKGMAIVTLFLGLLWYEAHTYKTHIKDYTQHGTEIMNGQYWSEAQVNSNDYQAIIPIPYFHTGSENFRTDDKQQNIAPTFALSQELGLPMTAVHMSRTSLSQTLLSQELHLFLLNKPKLDTALSEKPFLILVDQRADLEDYELQFVYHSAPVAVKDHFELRRMERSGFEKILKENRSKANKMIHDAEELEHTSAQIDNAFFFESFDQELSDRFFQGKGAKQVLRSEWTSIVPERFGLKDSTVYELSFWFYAGDQNAVNTQVWKWDFLDGEEVNFELTEIGDHSRAVKDGWILVSIPVADFGDDQTIKILLHRDGKKMTITIDELLLKPALLPIRKKGSFNVNNRYFSGVSL